MASTDISLVVLPRGNPVKNLPPGINLRRASPASELYQQLAASAGTSVHRLRVTKGSDGQLIPNSNDVSISQTGLMGDSKIYVKDLGPQIAWRTVFIVEYLGPLLIHPLVYVLRPYLYKSPNVSAFPAASTAQTLSLLLICIHFGKRELETLFVHRFSAATMPAMNIVKNSVHYWVLAGLNIAYWVYRPHSRIAAHSNPLLLYPGLLLFLVGELGNFQAHMTLRGLRSSGGKERGIPHGLGFGMVTCPNYMFETIAWVGIAMVTQSLSTVLFVVVAVGQMGAWAKKKERNYRREFGDRYKRKPYVMLPGIY